MRTPTPNSSALAMVGAATAIVARAASARLSFLMFHPPLVAAQEKNGGTERLFLEKSSFINPHVAHHQLLATTYIPPFKIISRPSSSRRTGYSLSSRA